MNDRELKRRIAALTPDQLGIVITYAHAWCPEAFEEGLALEENTRPAPPAGQGGVLFNVGDDDEALTAVAL